MEDQYLETKEASIPSKPSKVTWEKASNAMLLRGFAEHWRLLMTMLPPMRATWMSLATISQHRLGEEAHSCCFIPLPCQ